MCLTRRQFLAVAAGFACGIASNKGLASGMKTPGNVAVTVTGNVAPKSMGIVLPHEHLLVDFIGADKASRDRYDQDEVFTKALPYLVKAKEMGLGTLVDCTPEYLGRDAALLKRLSKASGVKILAPTGLYGAAGDKFLPPYAFTETPEKLAERWIAEWKTGIGGTGIKPGFIKIGVDPEPSEVDLKLARAAALTHRATGLTIASHTSTGKAALAQIDILKSCKVDPSAFVWVHANSEPDATWHEKAARQGAWVEFDSLSPDSVDAHVKLVRNMESLGLLGKTLVSHDAGWYNVGEPGGGTFRAFDTLFTEFIPALQKAGFDETQISRLIRSNPQNAFTRRAKRNPSKSGTG